MANSDSEKSHAQLEPELREMKLEGATSEGASEGHGSSVVKVDEADSLDRAPTPLSIPPRLKSRSKSRSPMVKQELDAPSPGSAHEETLGGDVTLKMEPGKAPKLSRTAAQKVVTRPPPLYLDLPDSTSAAKETFIVLPECTYANKTIGTTDPALECDCQEEYDSTTRKNHACGEDSDCINRATKMECVGDCGCGRRCQNQRFQRKQYADVSVIKTEKKGFGLRANKDMAPGEFVFEYIGEVIDERTFRRRMGQYDEEGIKHFYFMSLTKGEFVDATKKGNLGRFCNHSCNPNCFVDKWVVGDKLRMGIFVERQVRAGEELVFNYNVDRYGADPQPCYCGEPNCSGFIGGKTQSDNATKLSTDMIQALGIDDGAAWDEAIVAKKPRRKKASEDDEEYVNDLQPRELDEDGVKKIVPALRQCTEKWIAVKLLSRMQNSNERVGHRIVQFHGYQTLKKTLKIWQEDANVVLQVLDILQRLPRITRNKIQESGIEEAVAELKDYGDERVETLAAELLSAWSKLEVAYRIPRIKRDPNAGTPVRTENHFERRERGRERSRSRSKSPSAIAPKGPSATNIPSGPRALNAPRGPANFFAAGRPANRPRQPNNLPPGWFQATAENGSTYFYNSSGVTQWQRPTQAVNTPTQQNKAKSDTQMLQDIISRITSTETPTRHSASTTPQPVPDEHKEPALRDEKWRSLPIEKQEKIYEATLSPHVMAVTSSYRKKLDKEDVKRLSKEVAKKLVRGDYKSGRVKDPTAKISSNHEKTVRKYVKEFMDKAVRKRDERQKMKASQSGTASDTKNGTPATPQDAVKEEGSESTSDIVATMADDPALSDSASELKRKREEEGRFGSPKRTRTGSEVLQPTPPPPPPPPPASTENENPGLTPMDNALAPSSTEVVDRGPIGDKTAFQIDSHGSPMQLATPPTNGSGDRNQALVNGSTASPSQQQI
ncbi:uncharacterized protein yc1106_07727 [Curvularia clavata]|uniref:Histone-lysine N-methyltransferase, H3 lysine-36 specific n=1 Tax=Curvularia clavata TaxID=95742 RepID=A0A9Q9DU15_CURCL|nr:uncharacterized protein yc1106_07727 [Curvularia clavata]